MGSRKKDTEADDPRKPWRYESSPTGVNYRIFDGMGVQVGTMWNKKDADDIVSAVNEKFRKEGKLMLVNAKIEQAGLYFDGHYRRYYIMVVLETRGGGASIKIPVDKTGDFMDVFRGELDLENGAFVNELEGTPVVLKLKSDNEHSGEIVAIGDILASEDELFELED